MGLNCREGALSYVTVETWCADCLGRQQSLQHFLTEQVSQLSLRNDIATVSPALRSGKRLHNVLKSLRVTAWKRVQQ